MESGRLDFEFLCTVSAKLAGQALWILREQHRVPALSAQSRVLLLTPLW